MGKRRNYDEKEELFCNKVIEHLEEKKELEKDPRSWKRKYAENFLSGTLLPEVKKIASKDSNLKTKLETAFSIPYDEIELTFSTFRRSFMKDETYPSYETKLLFTLYCKGLSVNEYIERYCRDENESYRENQVDGFPFVGFKALGDNKDDDYIYGRENEIKAISNKIKKGCKFLIVLGNSGIGKSSLLKAGIINGLVKNKLYPTKKKFIPIWFRPYDSPFRSLLSKITSKLWVPEKYAYNLNYIHEDPERFSHFLREVILENMKLEKNNTEYVFAIDQMEELFSFDFSQELEKEKIKNSYAFLKMMHELSRDQDLNVRVFGAIREDFANRLSQYDFLDTDKSWLYDLKPMDKNGLIHAFTARMDAFGWECDEKLIEEIVDASGPDYDNATPFIMFALDKLQKCSNDRGEKLLRRSDYETMGKLEGMLQKSIDKILSRKNVDHELEKFYLGLIWIVDGKLTRRPLHPEVLAKSDTLNELTKKLVDERILTKRDSGFIEVTHEKVVEAWAGFGQYLEEHKADLTKFCQKEQNFIAWSDVVGRELNFPEMVTRDEKIAALESKAAAERLLISSQEEIDFMKLQLKKYVDVFSGKKYSEFERYLKLSQDYHDRLNLIDIINNGKTIEIIELLDKGVQLKQTDVYDKRIEPVFYAALTGNDDKSIIELLDDYKGNHPRQSYDFNTIDGSIINQYNALFTTKKSLTPLHLAVIANQGKIIRKIFLLGINPDLATVDGSTPLINALKHSKHEIVSLIRAYLPTLSSHKINGINYDSDIYEWTDFQASAYGGKTDFLKAIKRENIYERTMQNGWTLLALAVQKDENIGTIEYLLANGANPNALTDWGDSILDIAASKGNLKVVQLLLGKISLEDDKFLLKPIGWAATKGHYYAFRELLIKCQGQISDYLFHNHTIATLIARNHSIEEVSKLDFFQLLEEKKIDFTVRDNFRKTALNNINERKQQKLFNYLICKYPESWKIENKNARIQEIREKYDETTVWPDCSLVQCKWEYMGISEASDILNQLTEFYITENEYIPLTLGSNKVISLRQADMICLNDWLLFEALINDSGDLYILAFLTDGANIKILDGMREAFDHLWSLKAISLNTPSKLLEFVILFSSFVQRGNGCIGRLITEADQLKLNGETSLGKNVDFQIAPPHLEYQDENQLIVAKGTFLYNGKLHESRNLIFLNGTVNVKDLEFFNTLPYHKIAANKPLTLINENIINHLRLIKSRPMNTVSTMWSAIHFKDLDQIKRLILNGESPNQKFPNGDGSRPLHLACSLGDDYSSIVELLLVEKSYPNIRNDYMVIPLHIISYNNYRQLLEIILSNENTNVNLQEKTGYTALMIASQNGFLDVAERLVAYGALTEIEDLAGDTALFIAARYENWHIVRFLLSNGANIGHRNDRKENIIDIWQYYTHANKADTFKFLAIECSVSEEIQNRVLEYLNFEQSTSKEMTYKAFADYQKNKIAWPLLPKFQKGWAYLSKEDAFPFGQALNDFQINNNLSRTFDHFRVIDARSIDFEFYPNLTLVELYLENIVDSRHAIISFLFNEYAKDDDNKLTVLNGISHHIYRLNFEGELSFQNDEKLYLDYLRFFCSYVWGQEGGFWIVETVNDLPIKEPLDEKSLNILEKTITSPNVLIKEDNYLKANCFILYKKSIFQAILSVNAFGFPRVEDEIPMNIDIPVMENLRVGKGDIYRIV